MARATIADIARHADLSPATVDRALNNREGVSAINRQRVMQVARELGYLPSDGVIVLPSRPARLEFFVPYGQNSFMREVADSIREFSQDQPLVENARITFLDDIGPEAMVSALEQMSPDTDGIGVVATDHPKIRDALRRVCESGVQVITMASDVLAIPRAAYIGVDNHVAGRTAAQILGMHVADKRGRVAVFFGSKIYHGHQQREFGFRTCLGEYFPNLEILPAIETGEDSGRLRDEIARLMRQDTAPVGIYSVGAGRKGIIEALGNLSRDRRPAIVMHDLTRSSRQWLVEDRIDAVIDQNARLVGEQAVLRLLGAIASGPVHLPLHHIEPRIILRENIPVGQLIE